MLTIITLCLSCVEKYREAFTVERLPGEAASGKCDHCKKKSYVTKYEVSKK